MLSTQLWPRREKNVSGKLGVGNDPPSGVSLYGTRPMPCGTYFRHSAYQYSAFRRSALRHPATLLVICSQIALASACAGAPATEHAQERPAPIRPQVSAPAKASQGLVDADWGWLEASAFSLELPVPERESWQVDTGSGRWFSARHARTGDGIEVRAWSARRTVSRRECEDQLYLGRPELRRGALGELLDERRLGEPEGFDVWLRTWTEAAGAGTAFAVGAGPGRCFAAVFYARGDEAEVGSALRLAADGILSHVRFREVDDTRAPRPAPAF
jgi:hypothetical protein